MKAVMAFVKELYSERDTLTTELKVNTVAIEHAAGENWGTTRWRYLLEKNISLFLLKLLRLKTLIRSYENIVLGFP